MNWSFVLCDLLRIIVTPLTKHLKNGDPFYEIACPDKDRGRLFHIFVCSSDVPNLKLVIVVTLN